MFFQPGAAKYKSSTAFQRSLQQPHEDIKFQGKYNQMGVKMQIFWKFPLSLQN